MGVVFKYPISKNLSMVAMYTSGSIFAITRFVVLFLDPYYQGSIFLGAQPTQLMWDLGPLSLITIEFALIWVLLKAASKVILLRAASRTPLLFIMLAFASYFAIYVSKQVIGTQITEALSQGCCFALGVTNSFLFFYLALFIKRGHAEIHLPLQDHLIGLLVGCFIMQLTLSLTYLYSAFKSGVFSGSSLEVFPDSWSWWWIQSSTRTMEFLNCILLILASMKRQRRFLNLEPLDYDLLKSFTEFAARANETYGETTSSSETMGSSIPSSNSQSQRENPSVIEVPRAIANPRTGETTGSTSQGTISTAVEKKSTGSTVTVRASIGTVINQESSDSTENVYYEDSRDKGVWWEDRGAWAPDMYGLDYDTFDEEPRHVYLSITEESLLTDYGYEDYDDYLQTTDMETDTDVDAGHLYAFDKPRDSFTEDTDVDSGYVYTFGKPEDSFTEDEDTLEEDSDFDTGIMNAFVKPRDEDYGQGYTMDFTMGFGNEEYFDPNYLDDLTIPDFHRAGREGGGDDYEQEYEEEYLEDGTIQEQDEPYYDDYYEDQETLGYEDGNFVDEDYGRDYDQDYYYYEQDDDGNYYYYEDME
ncbi:uncharacterized protein LOC116615403 [Nematostella vectensis]|uniref:uncharacterized protein LOC116615403 n=1 Tax=Nematostella vectensis TaxID=45351 RepID=UPI0013904757|nr:uncharacterized protein LOC116615403 [Nematostella vectensis]